MISARSFFSFASDSATMRTPHLPMFAEHPSRSAANPTITNDNVNKRRVGVQELNRQPDLQVFFIRAQRNRQRGRSKTKLWVEQRHAGEATCLVTQVMRNPGADNFNGMQLHGIRNIGEGDVKQKDSWVLLQFARTSWFGAGWESASSKCQRASGKWNSCKQGCGQSSQGRESP